MRNFLESLVSAGLTIAIFSGLSILLGVTEINIGTITAGIFVSVVGALGLLHV